MEFSPSGRFLASCGWDKTIKIWNLETRSESIEFQGHKNQVLSLAWSPCEKYIASGGRNNILRIWSLEKQQEIKEFVHTSTIQSISWREGHIASRSHDSTIKIWKVKENDSSDLEITMLWATITPYLLCEKITYEGAILSSQNLNFLESLIK